MESIFMWYGIIGTVISGTVAWFILVFQTQRHFIDWLSFSLWYVGCILTGYALCILESFFELIPVEIIPFDFYYFLGLGIGLLTFFFVLKLKFQVNSLKNRLTIIIGALISASIFFLIFIPGK